MDSREFIYRIDAQDRILFANDNWFAFARENGVTVLDPARVIGRVLGDFLCHSETKHLFETLLAKVRATGASVALTYRCDSPDRRRFMEFQIQAHPRREVEFRSRILRQEMRDRVRLLEQKVEAQTRSS